MYYILNAAKNELDKHLINKITNESINETETHAQNENFLNICTSNLKDCNCEKCELVKVTVKWQQQKSLEEVETHKALEHRDGMVSFMQLTAE